MKRIRLGALQHSAVEIYVCDPALECVACTLEKDNTADEHSGATLVVHDAEAAWRACVDGANSADDDRDAELRDALTRLQRKLSRLLVTDGTPRA